MKLMLERRGCSYCKPAKDSRYYTEDFALSKSEFDNYRYYFEIPVGRKDVYSFSGEIHPNYYRKTSGSIWYKEDGLYTWFNPSFSRKEESGYMSEFAMCKETKCLNDHSKEHLLTVINSFLHRHGVEKYDSLEIVDRLPFYINDFSDIETYKKELEKYNISKNF